MSESFYDDEIAPKLMKLAKRCEERDMSLVALCEFERGDSGATLTVRENAGCSMRMVRYATQAFGNVDKLIMALIADGKKYGHSSMYLTMLENMEKQHEDLLRRAD